jgi:hypothetical protein
VWERNNERERERGKRERERSLMFLLRKTLKSWGFNPHELITY